MNSTIAISGGFDPVHSGHIDLIEEAGKHGGVIVILNSDEWLIRKKGFTFYSFDERKRILSKFKEVIEVVKADDEDNTVCETLKKIKPTYFANGGDRKADNTPELTVCMDLGIKPLFNIGGNKANSSSAIAKKNIVQRDWGSYRVLEEGEGWKVKSLELNPGGATSMQKHESRNEQWLVVEGSVKATRSVHPTSAEITLKQGDDIYVPSTFIHRLRNAGDKPAKVIEVQAGSYLGEDDIKRF